MKKILFAVFIVAGLLFCLSVFLENQILSAITKPIPVLVLLLLTKPRTLYNKFIFFGFVLSVFGDIFLLQIIDQFIFGLASFLIAHVFFIFAFVQRDRALKAFSGLPFYLIAGALIVLFYPYLGEMLVPVIIYILVIVTMVWRSYIQRMYNGVAVYAFIGAGIFAFSDTNIAITRFIQDYSYSLIVTIVLYWTAQYFIYKSTTKA